MKMIKMSALVLVSGLLFASCGDGANNDETPVDTMQMETPPMEEATPMPDTVNGIDTTVNTGGRNGSSNGASSMNNGSGTSGSRTSGNGNMESGENNTGNSTTGQPTDNPAKSPSNGNPANPPTRKAGSSPSM